MKAKLNLLLITFILISAIFNPQPFAQEADTSYMIEINASGDSTCFLLAGETKAEIDCSEAVAWIMDNPVQPADPAEPVEEPVQDPPNDPEPGEGDEKGTSNFFDVLKKVFSFIGEYWYIWILPLLEMVVRLTPSEKDNNILRILQSWIDKIIPNRRAGGGRFVAYDNKDSAPSLGVPGNKNLPK